MRIDPAALKRLRSNALLTQEELGTKAQMSGRAIVKLERGQTKAPRISTVRKLAEALGADPSEFMIYSEEPMGGKGSGRKHRDTPELKRLRQIKANADSYPKAARDESARKAKAAFGKRATK